MGKNLKNSTRKEAVEKIQKQFSDSNMISVYYVNSDLSDCLKQAEDEGRAIDSLIIVWKTPGHIDEYLQLMGTGRQSTILFLTKSCSGRKFRITWFYARIIFPKRNGMQIISESNRIFSRRTIFIMIRKTSHAFLTILYQDRISS